MKEITIEEYEALRIKFEQLQNRYRELQSAAQRMARLLNRVDKAFQPLSSVLDGEQWGAMALYERYKGE